MSVYDQLKKMMATLDDETYRRMVAELEEEKKAPPSLADGAKLYAQGDGMKIPRGIDPGRLAELLRQANPGDTFTVQDGRSGREIDLGR